MTYVLPLLLYACASFNRVGEGAFQEGKRLEYDKLGILSRYCPGCFNMYIVFYILKIRLVSTREFACIYYKYTFLFA